MAMAESIAELRSLSDDELINRHDAEAKTVQVSTKHYLDELHRRDQTRMATEMLRYTKRITVMTLAVTVLTIVNVVVAVFC